MEIRELLDSLGIDREGAPGDNGTYTVDITDSNEFGRFNSILDKSDLLEEVIESSYLTAENANLDYKFEDRYLLSLIADFDEDTYKLVIIEME